MAKGLMDENQYSSVTPELGKLFACTKGGGRERESRELLRVRTGESSVAAFDTNNTSLATRYNTTKRKIEEIWRSKVISKKLCHIKQFQEKPPVNLLFFPM